MFFPKDSVNTGIILVVVGVGGFASILVMTYLYRRRSSPVRVREVLLVLSFDVVLLA